MWFLALVLAAPSQALTRDVRLRLTEPAPRLEFLADRVRIRSGGQDWELTRGTTRPLETLRLTFERQPVTPTYLLRVERVKTAAAATDQGELLFSSRTGVAFPVEIEALRARGGGKNWPAQFSIRPNQFQIEAVAVVPFEEYLLGVVTHEMPGSWPVAALDAQAIATRSYTLFQLNERAEQGFDLEASVLDQDYAYLDKVARLQPAVRNWEKALARTKDQVLLGADRRVLKAYYHADCGGRTSRPEWVWGDSSDYRPVDDPTCERRARNRWQFAVAKRDFARDLSVNQDLRVQPVVTKADLRTNLLEVWRGIGQLQLMSGQNLRRLIGFDKIRSLRFQVQEDGDRLVFRGQGFGHGVGLCQWGTRDWALEGQPAEKILRHYYPQARLTKLPLPAVGSEYAAVSDR